MSLSVSSIVVDKLNLVISFRYYDPLLSVTAYSLTKTLYLFADNATWGSQPFDAARSRWSGLLTQYQNQTQLIWGGQVRRFKPLPNLQSENILLWVKWPYLAVCSNLTSSLHFTLKDAHLSSPIPGDRKGQLVIAAAVFRDQLGGLVVTESLKHCILDQCRLLTMLCCYSHSLCMSLLEPDLDLWCKGLKLVECRAWELCGVLKACTIISSLPCSVKRAS